MKTEGSPGAVRLWAWYAFFFFHELIPIYPLYGIMFVERGMSAVDLSVLFAAWSLAALMAEVPSGALADTVPRKWLLAVASLCKGVTYAIWLFAPGFWGFLIGFLWWGVSGALRSGTAEAMLHDTLRHAAREGDFTRIHGRIRAVSTASIGLAMFGGSGLVRFGYEAVLIASIAALCVAAAVAAVGFREPPRSVAPSTGGYFAALRSGIEEALRNRSAFFLVLLSFVLLPLGGTLDEFVGPVLKEKGFPKETAAALFATLYLAQVAGMLTAHRIQHVSVRWPLLIVALAGILLALGGRSEAWATPAGMAVFFALFALASTLFAGRLQAAIQGSSRATVTSVSGAAMQIGGVAAFLGFGAVSHGHSLSYGLYAVAAVAVGGAAAFMGLARRWGVD